MDDGKRYIRYEEIREILGSNVMHSHDEGSEACLNRQILNNSVKKKVMEDLCERPRKLIHRELQTQDLDTLTYKDISYISKSIHKARSFQLLFRPTDIEKH
jgi:hypothetical protein